MSLVNVREYLAATGRAYPAPDRGDSISSDAFERAGLPMVVECAGCAMTMALHDQLRVEPESGTRLLRGLRGGNRAMTREDRLEAKHRTAVTALMRAERKMIAATTRWLKLRERVRRYDRLADKALANRIGGEYDPREMAAQLDADAQLILNPTTKGGRRAR